MRINTINSLQFSHLFNSYTQAFNKMYGRKGSLFSPNFKRKELTDEGYLKNLIIYINTNPSHHGIADFKNYQFSSYKSLLSSKSTLLDREEVIELFDDK